MRRRFAIYAVATALLAACHSPQAAEAPRLAPVSAKPAPDIKGLKLGMTQNEVMAIFPHAKCKQERAEGHSGCLVNPVTVGGTENAELAVYLLYGKTIRIDAILLSPDKFDDMTAIMVAKFGRSLDDPRLPADDDHRVWVGAGWFLGAKRFDDEMFSSVSLVNSAHVADERHYEAAESAKQL